MLLKKKPRKNIANIIKTVIRSSESKLHKARNLQTLISFLYSNIQWGLKYSLLFSIKTKVKVK